MMMRLHFKMRTMLILLTAAVVWYGTFANKVIKQRYAVQEIRSLGGGVYYEHELNNGKPHAILAKLASIVGHDWFYAIETVEFNGGATDDALVHLRALPQVKHLYLADCPVTEAGLNHIAGLSQLEDLALHNAASINDGAVQSLAGLKHLKQLTLARTAITDASFISISRLPRIEVVTLSHTAVTDAGIQSLRNNKTIVCLELSGTTISDASASVLGTMPNLGFLGMNETRLTDEGLAALYELSKLRNLGLRRTQVSQGAVAEYKKLHPLVSVLYPSSP